LFPLYDKKSKFTYSPISFYEDIYLFRPEFERNKKLGLYFRKLNKKTMVPGPSVKITELDYSEKSKGNSGNFNFSTSPDSTKLLVYGNLPYEKGENQKFNIMVLDTDMSKIWEKGVTLPYIDDLFEVIDLDVSNDGQVLILGKAYEKRENKPNSLKRKKATKEGKPNYSHKVIFVSPGSETLREVSIEPDNYFLGKVSVNYQNDGNVSCVGFYSESTYGDLLGTYYSKIDGSNGTSLVANYYDLKDAMNQSDDESDTELSSNYLIQALVPVNDGGTLALAEYFGFSVQSTTSSSGRVRYTYRYSYNNIIAIRISERGEILWTTKIPKRQYTSNDEGAASSFALCVVDTKVYLVYNDLEDNLNETEYKKLKKYTGRKAKKAIVTLAILNNDGSYERQKLTSRKEMELIAIPKAGEQVSDNSMLLFGYLKGNERFLEISFE
ncbi:MAG: hypothetical protein AAF598_12875, partial [Bacteroidota bacterium]